MFDSMMEWLSINQRFFNVQRLKTINRRENFAGKDILASIAHVMMKPSTETNWKCLNASPDSSQILCYNAVCNSVYFVILLHPSSMYCSSTLPESAFASLVATIVYDVSLRVPVMNPV